MHSFQIKSMFLENRYTSLQPDIFSKKETHSSMIYTDHETKIISPPEAPPSVLLLVTVTPPRGARQAFGFSWGLLDSMSA